MSNQNHLSEAGRVNGVIESLTSEEAAQPEQITASQLAHLQLVYAEAEQAKVNLTKAIAAQQASVGARQSFIAFLFTEHGLSEGDIVDLETGNITRKE